MNYEKEIALVRGDMKLLMIEFNQIVKSESLNASRDPQIRNELLITANKFAKDYNNLQSKLMDLFFRRDLEEIGGKDKADLFIEFKRDLERRWEKRYE